MSDIVERLRSVRGSKADGETPTLIEWMREAAGEIERLRDFADACEPAFALARQLHPNSAINWATYEDDARAAKGPPCGRPD